MSARRWCAVGALVAALACNNDSTGPQKSAITATSVAPQLDTLNGIYEGVHLARAR